MKAFDKSTFHSITQKDFMGFVVVQEAKAGALLPSAGQQQPQRRSAPPRWEERERAARRLIPAEGQSPELDEITASEHNIKGMI